MATIQDVARKAGVSKSTVSNFLNGRYSISEEKYQKIKDAMEELHYRPNYMARNLKHPVSKIIGILLPSLDEPYSGIYQGILYCFDVKSYVVILKLTQNNTVLENQFIEQLIDIGANGIFLVPADPEDGKKYQRINDHGIPVVALERKIKNASLPYILFNNKQQVYDITMELLSKYSKTELQLYIGKREFSCEQECADGFLEAIPDAQGQITEIKDINREGIFNTIYQSFIHSPLPKAIIASSQLIALLFNEVCNIFGRPIPIHTLMGENWYITDVYKNIVPYGNNAILLGKKAAQNMEELLQRRYINEAQSIYVGVKQQYEMPLAHKPSAGNITLRVLAFKCDAAAALKKLSRSFLQHTGIHIEFHEQSYKALKKMLESCMENNSDEYDIYMMDLPWLHSILKKQRLYDMSAWVKKDRLLDKYPDTVRDGFFEYDRGIHTLPIIATTQVILYRQDLFESQAIKTQFMRKYGFELHSPRTWTEFNYIAEFFDRAYNPYSPFKHGTIATALEPVGLINEFLPRQWSFHGTIADKWGKICIDSEENVRALKNLVATFQYTPKGTENYFWDDIFEQLVKGAIPIAHGFASHYQFVNYSDVNTYERYIRCIPLPYNKSMLGGWALGINSNSRYPKECYDYLKWNLNDRVAIADMRLCGCTPVWAVFRNETLKQAYNWLDIINSKVELGSLREKLFHVRGMQVDPQDVDEILSAGILRAIHKEVDVCAALQEIKQNLNRLLRS